MPSQTYRMLQYGFRVEYDDPRVGELVNGLLGWFRLRGANGLPTYSLKHSPRGGTMLGYLNGRRFHEAATVGGLITRLLWRLNSEALKRTRTHILVHAAAASWSGRGIILPAAMESGKTTL